MSAGYPVKFMIFMLLIAAMTLTIAAAIGVYVYRDAKRRGMNAAAWTLIAVIAPALVGFIIYLLVRGGHSDLECPQCGTQVTERYVVCPRCGARLRHVCHNCAAPAERDWKVCPHCAAPLDGTGEGVTPPRRRQDKALGKILAVVIVAPVVLVAVLIAGCLIQPQNGSGSLQEVTFDEYLQLQRSEAALMGVHDWLNEIMGPDMRTDQAYILQYEYSGEFELENCYYMLIYVPGAGRQSNMGFGVGSGLFSPALVMELGRTGYDDSLFCVKLKSMRAPMPEITVDGRAIGSTVRNVDYNPTTFPIYPDYSQVEPEEVLFLPQRISVVKLERTGKGSSKTVDSVEVTDKDTLFKLMAAIDSGERLDWDHPIYEDSDISGGFWVFVEYQIHEEYVFHEDMARLHVLEQDGACYLVDERIRRGDNFRLMDGDFYGLLEGLFE